MDGRYATINIRDNIPCSLIQRGPETRRRCKNMSKYEIALVVSAMLEEEERTAVVERVKDMVQRFEGTVTTVDDWGKKTLAYEIQKMKEAFYYFIHFESDNAECPNNLEQQLRIMDGVIRYLVVREDED